MLASAIYTLISTSDLSALLHCCLFCPLLFFFSFKLPCDRIEGAFIGETW